MYSVYLAAVLLITVVCVHGANGEEDVVTNEAHYKEESLILLNTGDCHKDTLKALPTFQDLRIVCTDEAVDIAGLRDLYEKDIEPPATTDAFVKYLHAFESCKLRVSGALKNDYVDFDAYFSFLDLPKDNGKEEDLNLSELRAMMHTCRGVSGGATPVDTMINFDRCMEIKLMESCEFKDKHIGIENLLRIVFLSSNVPSKCPGVGMPKQDFVEWIACTKKQKESVKIPEFDGSDGAHDLAFIIISQEYMDPICKCFVKAKGFSNIGEYIASLDAWKQLPQQRMEISNAYATCVKHLETPVKIIEHKDGYDTYRESVTKMAKFIDCVTPEVSRICGLNSAVARMITPPLSPAFRDDVHKLFKELTGEISYHLVDTFKMAMFGP